MSKLFRKVFIGLLCFRRSSAIKCVSLNNEPCMIRPNFIDLSSAESLIMIYS